MEDLSIRLTTGNKFFALLAQNRNSKLTVIRIIGFLMMVIVGYLYLTGGDYSKLAGYFIYMSLACTIIPLPTPPYVIGMGKIFDPEIIALTGAFGNLIAAAFEYYLLTWLFSKTELQQKTKANRLFQRFLQFFSRSAFSCIVVSSFSPIPLDPFYLTAILTRYSIIKYLLALFIGKSLRYYLFAQVGDSFQIPNRYLIVMFIALVLVPVIIAFVVKRNQGKGCTASQESSI